MPIPQVLVQIEYRRTKPYPHLQRNTWVSRKLYIASLNGFVERNTYREPWYLPTQNRDFYRPKWRFRAKKKPHPVVFDVGWVLGTQSPLPSASTSSSCVEPCWAPALQLKFLSEIHSGPYIFVACINRQIIYQWIGLRENLQETSIFNAKNHGFLQIFPQIQWLEYNDR